MMMDEIWKDIKGYKGFYQVSNKGNVRSWRNNRWGMSDSPVMMGKTENHWGYFIVSLMLNSEQSSKFIHKEVAKAFIPNPENKPQVNHINGVKTDNRVENLEWCTHQENIQHAHDIGLFKHTNYACGENSGSNKLTKTQVLDIRCAINLEGITISELAKAYQVNYYTISRIVKRKTWKHI